MRLPYEPRIDKSRRQASERSGRAAEWVAAAMLMLRGYRILARRWKTHMGEIDLIAVRGARLAFVEVKERASVADAFDAISNMQSRRIREAAEAWLGRHTRYQDHDIHFDLVVVRPWRWPRLIQDGV